MRYCHSSSITIPYLVDELDPSNSVLTPDNSVLLRVPADLTKYESTAPLNITPKPDIVTRVFMVFRGVATQDLTIWVEAVLRTETMDIEAWRSIVGVDIEGMKCEESFRLVEWGGGGDHDVRLDEKSLCPIKVLLPYSCD